MPSSARGSRSAVAGVVSYGELLYFSTVRDSIVCPACQMNQFERGNGKCRRCHRSLGFTYIELSLPSDALNPQSVTAVHIEIGRLIRLLRSRRGITQAALSSLTGLNRTYLSRVECGQVMPSLISLIRIAHGLGMDKIMLRVRNSSVPC
jgi:DNA-binding XRE family transcriptional regulator